MNISEALLSGLVQGVTEFFPISSSGHLVLLHSLFGIREPQLAFDIFLHISTLAAILIYFRASVIGIFTKGGPILTAILTASVPTLIIALFLKGAAEKAFSDPKTVGYMLMITGLWLGLCSLFHRVISSAGLARRETPGIFGALMIGVAQGISVMPGISRSGATISTAFLAGLDGEAAFKLSFLMSVPAILGAGALKAAEVVSAVNGHSAACFLVGGAAALLSGLATIWVLDRMIRKRLFFVFGIYCVVAGAAVVLLNVR
jgi:undecaprenyl-diphosphatase